MDHTAEVLIIILAVVLVIFLIVLSLAVGFVISILRRVRKIVEQAGNVADSVEAAAETFERSARPLTILKIIGRIIEHTAKNRKKKG